MFNNDQYFYTLNLNSCIIEFITYYTIFSITQLVDAMMLMKDIKIDPSDLVSPDLVQELTNDIMTSMLSVNFKKVPMIPISIYISAFN